ncbi:MAG TPA: DUF4235 domain-containing protein [Streptosporangiaceae bacterium]
MINALAGAAAAYVARKAIGLAWTKATGRQPPDSDERQAGLGEAVAWAVVIGAGVGVARVLATRLATRQTGKAVTASQEFGLTDS